MSEKIEPALNAEDWENERDCTAPGDSRLRAYIIAVNNFALPDDDPRKITREKITMMRRAAWNVPEGYSGNVSLAEFADALESYLPPPDVA